MNGAGAVSQIARVLRQQLETHQPAPGLIWLAYSGGLDSRVLLEILVRDSGFKSKLRVLHVDHALQSGSADWAQHCAAVCRQHGIAFCLHRLDPNERQGEGPEDAARRARYNWMKQQVRPGDVLLLAHHMDDQAETVLANLFRGSGVTGLAAMPAARAFAGARLLRPMLELPRSLLERAARELEIHWIEDPSNSLLDFDRNRIRHRILPEVRQRWPQVNQSLARVAQNLAESLALAREVGAQDMNTCAAGHLYHPLSRAPVLSRQRLLELSPARQVNLLRYWIGEFGASALPRKRFRHLLETLVNTQDLAHGAVAGRDFEIRRYRNHLYFVPADLPVSVAELNWNTAVPLPIPGTGLELFVSGEPAFVQHLANLKVTFTNPRKPVRLAGRPGARPLRKVFQDYAIPPWLRRVLPRVFHGGVLIAIPGPVEIEPPAGLEWLGELKFELRSRSDRIISAVAD